MRTRSSFLLLMAAVLGVFSASWAGAQNVPPVITVPPSNRVAAVGGSVSFTVTATGTAPLGYRWRKDEVPLLLSTNSRVLSMFNLSNGSAGAYSVVVTNLYGAVTSPPAFLTVTGAPPRIVSNPTNVLICAGGPTISLRVQATGSPSLSYQWLFEGLAIPGQTTSTLLVLNDPSYAGGYSAIVSNAYGVVTSQVARLELGPRIVQQPVGMTVGVGSNAFVSVIAAACPSAWYQWRQDGINVPGGTNATLFFPTVGLQHEGDYTVVVTDGFRSVTSVVARLTVQGFPPRILSGPSDWLPWMTNVNFSVAFDGAPTPTVQWLRNGVVVPGATSRFLSFLALPANQGRYSAVLSNAFGVVTSAQASFFLPEIPPTIFASPRSTAYCPERPGQPEVALQVVARSQGVVPTYYSWSKDGVPLFGQTNSFLYLSEVNQPFGEYWVVAYNFAGSVRSETATVAYGAVFVRQPLSLNAVTEGAAAGFDAEVSSCGPLSFQWWKNGVELFGETNVLLLFDQVTREDTGDYTLVVRHDLTTITSQVARLEIEQSDPYIIDGTPADWTVNGGDFVTLSMAYGRGYPPADIQWYRNGQVIPGATNEILEFAAMSPEQHGRYHVTLSNINLVVTSRLARVQVYFSSPLFDMEPEDVTRAIDGSSVSFYSFAIGAPPPQYQWFFNGVPIRGQTNDWMFSDFLTTNQIGGYSVVASNFLGSVTSRVATLSAELYPPAFFVHPVSQSFRSGDYVFLVASATGSPLPQFQWYHNGVSIPGENLSQLRFQAGFRSQEGTYYAVASNYLGVATSLVAQITIQILPPSIVLHPLPQQKVAGESFYLTVQLSNNIPALVQWQRDGINLAGETNTYIIVRTARTNDAGEYRAIAWNDAGTTTSRVARVDVRLPESLDRWSWRRSLPQGNDLRDVAYGDGRFLAVGENGALVISTNGMDWSDAHKPGHSLDRDAVVFGNGVFRTDEDRLQLTSNGIELTNTPITSWRPCFGNGVFVSYNGGTTVAISTNGIQWDVVQIDPSTMGDLAGYWDVTPLAFVNDRFLASFVSYNPSPGPAGLLYSTNGLDWHLAEIAPSDSWTWQSPVVHVAYGDGVYLGLLENNAPEVLRSTDGVHWSRLALSQIVPVYPTSIAAGNGRFVVSGYPTYYAPHASLAHSADGQNWTLIPTVGSNTTYKVRFLNDRFVAVGAYGRLLTSTNGIDWLEHNPGSDLNIRGITRANEQFVAVGNNGVLFTSPDGREWTRRELGTNVNLRSVTHFAGRYIAVTESDANNAPDRISIYTSRDALHWQSALSAEVNGRGDLYGIAHGKGTIVAVGDRGAVTWSKNGEQWFDSTNASVADLNAVMWNGTAFYAAGKDGTVLASTNGTTWQFVGPGGGRNLHGIAYGNGVFVTVGNGGRYYVGDGSGSWSRFDWGETEDLSDIIFAGGRFIAIGDNGIMHTSTNGTKWTRRVNPSDNDFRNILYDEGSYWIVGNNETILQSAQIDPALRIRRTAGTTDLTLELLGEAGVIHRVQGSQNLTDWTDILMFTTDGEGIDRRALDPNASGWRFYRVATP